MLTYWEHAVNDNIISVNIPNGISILIMVVLGGVLLTFAKKALGMKKGGPAVASGPNFTVA